jgi:hypothetical protein
MMVLRHPFLLNSKSISECCPLLEETLILNPECLGQVRPLGTRLILPLLFESDFRRGRFLWFIAFGEFGFSIFSGDMVILECAYLKWADLRNDSKEL